METRTLGHTDLNVTRLGFGGARIGYEDVTPDQSDRLLNGLLDMGVTFYDTAACYHDSEEQIGRAIGARRDEYVLASKCGHVTGGATGREWSAEVIAHSVPGQLAVVIRGTPEDRAVIEHNWFPHRSEAGALRFEEPSSCATTPGGAGTRCIDRNE